METARNEQAGTIDTIMKNKFRRRWKKMSGGKKIDLSIPQVHLEYMLCSERVISSLETEDGLAAFIGILTDEEREIFFHGPPDDREHNYYDEMVKKRNYSSEFEQGINDYISGKCDLKHILYEIKRTKPDEWKEIEELSD